MKKPRTPSTPRPVTAPRPAPLATIAGGGGDGFVRNLRLLDIPMNHHRHVARLARARRARR